MHEPDAPGVAGAFLDRHHRGLLLGILALGALLRIATHLSLASTDPAFSIPSLDGERFLDWARSIAGGDGSGTRVFFLNPLYAYALAPVVLVFGPTPLTAIRVFQMALGLATCYLLGDTARRLFGRRVGLLTALLAAIWPVLLFYEQYVMIVTVAVFLNALTLFLLARAAERPTLRRFLLAGVALGLSILARPNVGLFAVLLPAWLLATGPAGGRWRFALARTGVLALGAVLVVLPATIRNLVVGGDFVVVSSSGGVNLYCANNAEARRMGRMVSPDVRSNPALMESDSLVIAERETGRNLKPSEVSSYFAARALREAARAPGAALRFLGSKFLMFFRSYEIPSSCHYWAQKAETPVLRWNPLAFGLLSPFAVAGFVVVLLRRREALPLALLFATYVVAQTIFLPTSHGRAPVLAAALPLGALGVAWIATPLRERRYREALRRAPVLALGALLAFAGPVGRLAGLDLVRESPDDAVVFGHNRGVLLLGQHRIDEAEAALAAARDADPTAFLPHTGLALVARARGDLARERHHLTRALELRPGDPAARIGLARNLFDTGRRAEAFALGNQVLREAPKDGTVLTGLALMCADAGEFDDAYVLLVRAERSGIDRLQVILDQCWCLRSMDRPREALSNAERGLALNPVFAPLHFERARALRMLRAPPDEVAAALLAGLKSGAEVPEDFREFLTRWRRLEK